MTTKELIKADCSRYYGKSDFKTIQKTKYIQSGFKYIVEYRKINRYIKQSKKGLGYYYHRIKFLRYSKKNRISNWGRSGNRSRLVYES